MLAYKSLASYRPAYLVDVIGRLTRVPAFRLNLGFWLRDVPVLLAPRFVAATLIRLDTLKGDVST